VNKENMKIKQYLPGLAAVTLIAIAGKLLSNIIINIGSVTLAIIIGIIVGNLLPKRDRLEKGISFSVSKILPFAIMLLGVELQLKLLLKLGLPAILMIIIMVSGTIIAGFTAGKLLGLNPKFSLLMGCGNAICGSSAIAAVAPVIGNDENEIGLSIGVVNLMGTIGIFILPAVAHFLNLSDIQSGGLIGGILQAVGQVVAAGYSVSDKVGNISVIIKMGRVLMLGPVVAILAFIIGRINNSQSSGNSGSFAFPKFIIGFFIFSFLASYGYLNPELAAYIKSAGKILLLTSMSGVGMQIKFSALIKQGPDALKLGTVIVIFQFALAVGMVYLLF